MLACGGEALGAMRCLGQKQARASSSTQQRVKNKFCFVFFSGNNLYCFHMYFYALQTVSLLYVIPLHISSLQLISIAAIVAFGTTAVNLPTCAATQCGHSNKVTGKWCQPLWISVHQVSLFTSTHSDLFIHSSILCAHPFMQLKIKSH